MVNQISGNLQTRQVWLDGEELLPDLSQVFCNCSPDGFNWGHGGSGPAQLALALLLEFVFKDVALSLFERFKWEFIDALPASDFNIELDIEQWIERMSS